MPGDAWQKYANLRLLYGYQWALPAKKLLFMGDEIAEWREWDHDTSLDWHLLDDDRHAGIARLVADLNRLYAAEPPLYHADVDDRRSSGRSPTTATTACSRSCATGPDGSPLLWVANFTPIPRHNFRAPVPVGGRWLELCNTDASRYGGGDVGNYGAVDAVPAPLREHDWSLTLTLPPLGAVFLRPERTEHPERTERVDRAEPSDARHVTGL